jgi:hypothetical protein
MTDDILRKKLSNVANKVLKQYRSKVELVNTLHKMGTGKHECMILELIYLGKPYESIRKILLFSEDSYAKLLAELYDSLRLHNKKKKHFIKIGGTF